MREVSLLIERAVSRTLVERTLSVPPEVVTDLVQGAQAEFISQVEGLQDLADSRELVERHKTEWRASLDELRAKVAERRALLERDGLEETPAALHERRDFERALAEAAGSSVAPRQRAAFIKNIGKLHADSMAREREALCRAHDSELSQIERRLGKLVGSLEAAEVALERAASARAADMGIESIYKNVQGLPSQERGRELKAALMASIFEANLALLEQRAREQDLGKSESA